MSDTRQKPARRSTAAAAEEFTEDERAAMKEHAQEVRRARGRGPGTDPEAEAADVLAKIAAMAEPDRTLAERVHAIVTATAPTLAPRTWYGMPAYAANGAVVCFFQPGQKFKTRYATLGFSDKAQLDDGRIWPTAYALTTLTAADEERIAELVRRAVGAA